MVKRVWFKAKPYGYGWYPSTWEGWLITLGFILYVVLLFVRMDAGQNSAEDTLYGMVIPLIIGGIILFSIAFWKGEKLGWRWGNK